MAKYDDSRQLRCSFCGKTQDQVRRLVAGPGVYICDECISLCNDIISEEFALASSPDIPDHIEELPKPKEIMSRLSEYVIGQERLRKTFL